MHCNWNHRMYRTCREHFVTKTVSLAQSTAVVQVLARRISHTSWNQLRFSQLPVSLSISSTSEPQFKQAELRIICRQAVAFRLLYSPEALHVLPVPSHLIRKSLLTTKLTNTTKRIKPKMQCNHLALWFMQHGHYRHEILDAVRSCAILHVQIHST